MEYEQKWGTALPHLVPKPSSFSILLILGASCRGFSGLESNRATKYEGSGLFHGHMEISYPKISSEMFDEDMERGGGGRGTWHMTVESENRREPLFQWQSFTKECVVNLWSQSTTQQNNSCSYKHSAGNSLENYWAWRWCITGWGRIISQRWLHGLVSMIIADV